MIVIADTSPLNYLVLIGEADILQRLYGRVVIPEAVLRELLHPETPTIVSEWIARRPAWLEVERITTSPDPNLRWLGEGECEAIMLAEQHGQDVLLLMDEGRGRREAQRRRLRITGTLGVLKTRPHVAGWIFLLLSSAFGRPRCQTLPLLPENRSAREERSTVSSQELRCPHQSLGSFSLFG